MLNNERRLFSFISNTTEKKKIGEQLTMKRSLAPMSTANKKAFSNLLYLQLTNMKSAKNVLI